MTHIAHVQLQRAGRTRGQYYEAQCSCGWIGPAHLTMRRAYDDLDKHESEHPIESHINSKLSEGAE